MNDAVKLIAAAIKQASLLCGDSAPVLAVAIVRGAKEALVFPSDLEVAIGKEDPDHDAFEGTR